MAQKRIVSYIDKMLKQGYNISSIRAQLVKSGYSKGVIEEAINDAYAPKVRHEIHFSKSTLVVIGILFLGLVIVAVSMIIISSDSGTKKLLDLRVDILESFVEKGDNVEFNVDMSSFGTEERYDVTLNYNILDSNGKVVKFKTETAAVETRTSLKSNVRIPDNLAAGDYILKVTAEYGKNIATASDSFSIVEENERIVEPEPIKKEPLLKKPIEKEKIKEPEEPEEEKPFEPVTEDLEKARELAQKNPQEAVNYCGQITKAGECYTEAAKTAKDEAYCADIIDDEERDDCYSIMAERLSKSEACREITDDSNRDICYTNFVTDGDYSVCEELTLKYLKDSCKQLKVIEELQNK